MAGAIVCLSVLAACAGGGDSSTSSTTRPTRSDGAATDGPGCRYIVAGTERRSTTPGKDLMFLTAAVAEPTTCYDKITFTFDPGDGPDLPPGYTVEYREPPFLEGVRTSTEGFKDAKYVLYVEFRPVSTEDTRLAGRAKQTYKGNLRLTLADMKDTVIVEWLDSALPSVPEATTGPSVPRSGGPSTTTTLAPAPDAAPTTTTTLAPNDPATSRVVWLIGLDAKRPFTVDAVNRPPRVSVIVMH